MNATYSIIPIGTGLLIAYLISFSGTKLGIIHPSGHRKFWNMLLLLAFFTTATLGLLLAIQVNYKLTIPSVDSLMVIHVDFGIALVMISIFHLSWHLNYYLKLFSKNENVSYQPIEPEHEYKSSDVTSGKPGPVILEKLPVIALGSVTIITQIVILREFLSVFLGNELVIGVILANWMLLTGFGAWLGRYSPRLKNKNKFVYTSLILLGVLPLIIIFLLNFLKNIVFIPGSQVGIFEVFYSSFFLLAPFCLLSGYSFSFYSYSLSSKYRFNLISRVYGFEATGSLIGGAVCSFLLVYFLKSMQILAIVFIFNTLIAFLILKNEKVTFINSVLLIASVVISISMFVFPVDKFNKHFLYINQEILLLKDTPYGNLVISKTGDQLNFYENNALISNTLNIVANEEDVHYALVQRSDPENVLIISGGVSGIINEILKYNVKRIDYVEINPWIVKAGRVFAPELNNEKVQIINRDARQYVSRCNNTYNAVLINLPPPFTAQLNRYYSLDFFQELKTILEHDGIISLGLPASPNYESKEANKLYSLIYNTLKRVFSNVIIIPGEKNYFIASDLSLRLDIAQMITEKNITNEYVSEYYIDDQLLFDRSNLVLSRLPNENQVNSDLNPRAYFNQISYWLSHYKFNTKAFFILLGIIFIVLVTRLKPVTAGMFAGGFAGASVEILLIFIFQILYGYAYLMIGAIITVFMAGIALGALSRNHSGRSPGIRHFLYLEILIGAGAILVPALFLLLKILNLLPIAGQIFFLLFTFGFSFLVGKLFRAASLIQSGKTSRVAAVIYSIDLVGAAFGAIIVSGLLLPLLGLWKTAILTGALCLLAASYTYAGRNKIDSH